MFPVNGENRAGLFGNEPLHGFWTKGSARRGFGAHETAPRELEWADTPGPAIRGADDLGITQVSGERDNQQGCRGIAGGEAVRESAGFRQDLFEFRDWTAPSKLLTPVRVRITEETVDIVRDGTRDAAVKRQIVKR
ncbi:MAG TPA: hypothetical protein PLU30_00265 [Verrucomicrobiae bacterium]|nr:hypothetical protein [Verrucomicrobiae bacterium]